MGKYFNFSLIFVLLALSGTSNGKSHTDKEIIAAQMKIIDYVQEHKAQIVNWIQEKAVPFDDSIRPQIDYINCEQCHLLVQGAYLFDDLGIPDQLIIGTVIIACNLLQIVPASVCTQIVQNFAPPTLYILKHSKEIGLISQDVCGILEGGGCGDVSEHLTNWTINVDPNKPEPIELPPLPNDIALSKILHFTDLHLDMDYIEGSNGKCNSLGICCRCDPPLEGDPEAVAGPFGHGECGLPLKGLHAVYNHAKTTFPDPKYIFLTGDYVHSGIWMYSVPENSKNIKRVAHDLQNTFPNTPLYAVVGNHETDVCNLYPPGQFWDEFDLGWMYEIFVENLSRWVEPDQIELFKKYGYYYAKPEPGFRIIVLNTNLCYVNNFWLIVDAIDTNGELQWFHDTLLEAERDGEVVYVVGHIPPGSGSCWPVWSDKFAKIVKRFRNIIKAQFYGHGHQEEFILTFEDESEDAAGMAFMGPSVVPSGSNPAYKIYTVDGERGTDSTWEIENHETWALDLLNSNALVSPVFKRLFNAKEYFGLNSLRPSELYELVKEFVSNHNLFLKYQRAYYKEKAGQHRICTESDKECKYGYLCSILQADSSDYYNCEKIREIMGLPALSH